MSLKIRFRFDGKCSLHPRYNPKRDGRPSNGKCEGCESLYVVHLYTAIAIKRSKSSHGIVVRFTSGSEEPSATDDHERLSANGTSD